MRLSVIRDFYVYLQSAMRHYALIGRTLSHSYSKGCFDAQHFPDADYRLYETPSVEGIRQWVEREHIDGFNVTVPYKQTIIGQLDALSPEAESIGAVNCVAVNGDRLVGHNTDAPAFQHTLLKIKDEELRMKNFSQAYILGTGGAARAVAYALGLLGIPHTFVSRTPENHENAIGYSQLSTSDLQLSTLIVNATPVGMYPKIDATPLDITHAFKHSNINAFVYDLVYNPSPTLLMQQAAACGAQTKDGLEMLRLQARLSWHLWGLV